MADSCPTTSHDPLVQGYGSTTNCVPPPVTTTVVSVQPRKAVPTQTGTLPFTGLTLWLFLVIALALVGLGLILRRVSRSTV